jgi:hypothetical protein
MLSQLQKSQKKNRRQKRNKKQEDLMENSGKHGMR